MINSDSINSINLQLMKKLLLTAGLLLATGLATYAYPAGVSNVSPAPGIIDVSNNACPLGASDIAITFTGSPAVNPAATGFCCIYVNGSTTPAEELPVSEAVIDAMGLPMGGITFKHIYNAPGKYRVTIPEGVWTYGDDNALSPALDLDYQILPGLESYPAPGVVHEISEFSLKIEGASKMQVKNPAGFSLFSLDDIAFTATTDGDEVYVTVDGGKIITDKGTYTLIIDAGAIEYTDAAGTVRSNQETIFKYIITDLQKPAADPAEGAVDKFGKITLAIPEDFSVFMTSEGSVSGVFPVKSNGTIGNERLIRYNVKQDGQKLIYYPVDDMGVELDEVELPAGAYAFCPAEDSAFGSWSGGILPPYVYYYRIEGGQNPEDSFVYGTVYDPEGNPAAGISVTVTNSDFYALAVSEADGSYMITDLPEQGAGKYNVMAFDMEGKYYYEASADFAAAKGNKYDIRLTAPVEYAYTLTVEVTNENGVSLNGATVTCSTLTESMTTDELGQAIFGFENEEQIANLTVTVALEGYETVTSPVVWNEGETEKTLKVTLLPEGGGVSGILSEGANAIYYNLQGQRVATPAPGQTLIRILDGKAHKIIIK